MSQPQPLTVEQVIATLNERVKRADNLIEAIRIQREKAQNEACQVTATNLELQQENERLAAQVKTLTEQLDAYKNAEKIGKSEPAGEAAAVATALS